MQRKKPRDFYNLYFLMRKGMFSLEQRRRLKASKEFIITEAEKIRFKDELSVFLPTDQESIIRIFPQAPSAEMDRQIPPL
jgi:hypothetical protein